jgi:hypothetical protein
MRHTAVIRTLAVMMASACSIPVVCGCDVPDPGSHAVVFGSVKLASGASVTGARVTISGRRGTCAAPGADAGLSVEQLPAFTDPTGAYRATVTARLDEIICVRVSAEGPTSPGNVRSAGATSALPLHRATQDSVRLDVTLIE